ncbi:sulfotransferase family protein [Parahaliea aestuarii]|uniref:Sulfotransferase n=1 Tax=Parahaliea aestuarii TaxID=1852021 RepID=A0A5C8ZMD4_9GAMM|nr:sulfotransferase [Parahaliea aestuarii]TXS89633.1 sulfotransferase [Parahaliea aestuarii]
MSTTLFAHHEFAFIAGVHRSGTSLVHELLRAHPEISGFKDTPAYMEDEGQFLQSVYPRGEVFGGPGRFAFSPDSHMTEEHPLTTRENAQTLFSQWSQYWDLRCPVLIEKSPPNIVRTRFLQALFPNTRFIVILRHPVAVAYATQKWSHTSILSIIDHTLTAYEQFLRDRPALRQSLLIHYEDFVLAPQKLLDEMLDFLGLPSIPLDRPVQQDVNARYFEQWQSDRRKFWKPVPRRLPKALEPRARALGYSLESLERVEPG